MKQYLLFAPRESCLEADEYGAKPPTISLPGFSQPLLVVAVGKDIHPAGWDFLRRLWWVHSEDDQPEAVPTYWEVTREEALLVAEALQADGVGRVVFELGGT